MRAQFILCIDRLSSSSWNRKGFELDLEGQNLCIGIGYADSILLLFIFICLRMILIRHYQAIYGLRSSDFSHRLRFLEDPIRFLVKVKREIRLEVLNLQISREALVSIYLKIC